MSKTKKKRYYKMNEKEEIIISTNQKSIVEYIFDNPRCAFNQIKKNFKGKISLNNLKFYLRGKYDIDGKYEDAYLIRIGHIISYDEDKYGNNDYPDIFEVNMKFMEYYPDLVQKTHMKIAKDLDLLGSNLLKNQVDKFAHIIDTLMQFGIDIELVQNPTSKKIYLSDFASNRFSQILKLMVYECFLNNPDVWHVFYGNKDFFPFELQGDEKKEDLDFSINIKLNFSKIPHFYERLGVLTQFRILTRDLYDNNSMQRYCSLIKEKKKNRKLEHIDFKSFYANAKFENEERDKLINATIKTQNNKKEFEKTLENYENEIFREYGDADHKIGDMWKDILNKQKQISNNKKNEKKD